MNINNLLSKAYLPLTFKIFSLVGFFLIIVIGLLANSTDALFINHLRNTNFGNLIVWSYWWPAIIIFAILFGRVWCMVCPVELVTSFFAKIGLKLKRPKWILSGWVITIFYIIILFIGIQGFAIHRDPFSMSVYLLVIFGASVLVGLIFEKNTFCRYVCPIGYLLGLYSKLSFFGWRVKNKSICEGCNDKSCISKKYWYNMHSKSCGVDLYPANIDDNSNCILCAGCIQACETYQSKVDIQRPNPAFRFIGFANDLFLLKPFKVAEMVFVLVVSGFVISEIWSEWPISNKLLNYLPSLFIDKFGISSKILSGVLKGGVLFGLVPFVVWLIPYFISRLAGSAIKLKDYFVTYGIAFIPIIAAAHLAKAILKSTSRIPYFEHAFNDLSGLSTAQAIIDGTVLLQKNPGWLNFTISVLLTLIILGGVMLSTKMVMLINRKNNRIGVSNYLIPLVYGSVFFFMILIWRWF